MEPKERPLDGFLRGDWTERKERGKDAQYEATRVQYDKVINPNGAPGSNPGTGGGGAYNPNPTPGR